MSRAQPVVDHVDVQRVVEVALARFERRGYQGTSIREIAAAAGLSIGALYDYFPSKQLILLEIIDATYTAAVAQMEAAVAAAGDEPARRLEAAVWAQCDFCTRAQRSCRVAEAELANLAPEYREAVLAKRVRLWQIFGEIIADGAARGAFDVKEPEAISRALSAMCVAIGDWYDPGGHEVPRQIAQTYCELAERMAGVRLRGARRGGRLTAAPARRSA
jgi:AcrR family transcriptional regulator